MFNANSFQLFFFTNPRRWGFDSQDNAGLMEELDYEPIEDGTFWMDYNDFVNEFNKLHICRLFPPSWHQLTIKVGVVALWSMDVRLLIFNDYVRNRGVGLELTLLEFNDFVNEFNKLHICRLFPPSWHQLTIKVGVLAVSSMDIRLLILVLIMFYFT